MSLNTSSLQCCGCERNSAPAQLHDVTLTNARDRARVFCVSFLEAGAAQKCEKSRLDIMSEVVAGAASQKGCQARNKSSASIAFLTAQELYKTLQIHENGGKGLNPGNWGPRKNVDTSEIKILR